MPRPGAGERLDVATESNRTIYALVIIHRSALTHQMSAYRGKRTVYQGLPAMTNFDGRQQIVRLEQLHNAIDAGYPSK